MNNCQEYQEHLSSYVDGELKGSEAARIEKHLATCESCSAILGLYRGVSAALQESLAGAPAALREGAMDKIRSEGSIEKIGGSSAMGTTGGDSATGMIRGDSVVHIDNHTRRRRIVRTVLTRYVPIAACLAVILLALPRVINLDRSANDMMSMDTPKNNASSGGSMDGSALPPMMPAPSSSGAYSGETAPTGGSGYSESPNGASNGWSNANNQSDADRGPTNGYASSPEAALPSETPHEPGGINPDDGYPADAPSILIGGDTEGEGLEDTAYYAIIEISGELPKSLVNYTSILVDDLTLHYFIPRDAVQGLVDELAGRSDVTIYAMDLTGEQALVIYTRER